MDRRLVAGAFWALLVVACDSSSGSGDSETHWLKCTTDLDCPGDQYCENKICVPRSDAGSGGANSGSGGANSGSGGANSGSGGGRNGAGAGTSTGGTAPSSNGAAPSSNGGARDAGASMGGAHDASAGSASTGGAHDASLGDAGGASAGGASTGGASGSSTGGGSGASAGGASGASSEGGPGSSAGGSDASVDGGTVGRDASEASVPLACDAPGSDIFVDPVNGNDRGSGSGESSGAPSPECAFKTITRAIASLPATPPSGTRIIVIGPATVDTGETWPIALPTNVVLTTQGGDVIVKPTSNADSIVLLAHPSSGIRGGTGAALTLQPMGIDGVDVGPGSDDSTFIEDVAIPGYQSVGIWVYPEARITVGEGVTASGNAVGMVIDGHATISVPAGHRTTSFSRSRHLDMPPPPMEGQGLLVSGSVTIHGVPGATPGTGTVVVNDNCGTGVRIGGFTGETPPETVIDGLVVYGNGTAGPFCAGYYYSGIFIGGGSNVKIRNSVVLGNGGGVKIATITTNDGRRQNDLGKIDLGVATLADGGSDWGHNVLQALPDAGANLSSGLCLLVDHNSGALNAAGNVFAGPRDCAGTSPGTLTFSNDCSKHTDLGIITQTDGGLFMGAGGTRGNTINAANCTR